MKRILLVIIAVLLFSTIVHADIVTFERKTGMEIWDVQGDIWIYNNLLNIWEQAPVGTDLIIRLTSSIQGVEEIKVEIHTTSPGSYGHSFGMTQAEKDNYDQVIVEFMGSYYYDVFDQYAHVDIWWVQAH